jgi:hypothetical protein
MNALTEFVESPDEHGVVLSWLHRTDGENVRTQCGWNSNARMMDNVDSLWVYGEHATDIAFG